MFAASARSRTEIGPYLWPGFVLFRHDEFGGFLGTSLHRTRGALRVDRLDAVSDLGLQGRVVDVCSKRSFSYRDRTVSLVRLYDSAMMKLVVFLVHRGLHR